MDNSRFDAITKSVMSEISRRRALGGLFGGALGLLGLADPTAAAPDGTCKPRCGACERCKKGACRRTAHGRRCTKGNCKPKPNGRSCGACRACQRGECVAIANETACGDDGPLQQSCRECQQGACVARQNGSACGGAGTVQQSCQNGVCTCTSAFGLCQGECHPGCGTQVRNPTDCSCCKLSGSDCEAGEECCSGTCGPLGNCLGRAQGSECDFDAQCASNDCGGNGRCGAA